ncbi:RICIN domain-containing protein [Paenibacillus alba]|uniref:RICIN domain-containing protein n=1 Tax=Paenibacillus alba TaxID=1197127 RepID=UPI0015674C92|nr:RICIN domain-containing protein [Paenibacillus alba]NQX71348.1 RICIN domain-containing protein [Paenibacillus alba]
MRIRHKLFVCLSLGFTLFVGTVIPAFADTYTNQKNYADLRFGMFIHYNMATYTNEEWATPGQNQLTFNPTTVNTDQWADAAVSAKMKFAVLTTKHHDGFALWPTKYGNYNVMNSAYPHDIVKQFVDSMRSRGITPGLYYSIWDRQQGIDTGTVSRADIDFIKGQLTELLTNYGEIPVLIFDGWGWKMGHNEAPYQKIREHVKRLQPNILISDHNTVGQPWNAEVVNFEEPVGSWSPANNTYVANQGKPLAPGGWFWHPTMTNAQLLSVSDVVYSHLGDLEPKYTNFMLNVSPNRQGELDPNVLNRLTEIGEAWSPNLSRAALPVQPTVLEHPITANSAAASSGNARNAIDGLMNQTETTVWQSSSTLPQSVTLDLGYTYNNINMLKYLPVKRLADGKITSYSLYSSQDGTNFSLITSGTWNADTMMKEVTFPSLTARYIKLQANSASGGYAAANDFIVGSYTSEVPTPTGIDTFDPNAVYRIVNKGSGKALGVGSALSEGAAVAQRTSLDAADQQWIIDDLGLGNLKLVNKLSGKAINVSGGSTSNGASIIQSADTETSAAPPGKSQQWTISGVGNGYFKIANVNSGKVLENLNGSSSDGNPADQRAYNGNDRQLWQMQKIADSYDSASYYKIVNLKSNKVLDIIGGSPSPGADTMQAPYTGANSQLWKVESVGNGQYKILNKNSGCALVAKGGSIADGALINQWTYTATTNQLWNIEFIGKGLYHLSNVRSGKALEVKDGSVLDGSALVQNPYTSSPEEQWAIVKVQ